MSLSGISDIIDNKRLSLEDAINDHLKGTEEAKSAVGYLFLSGFNEIAALTFHT